MRNVYAVQFQLKPQPSSGETWASAAEAVTDWVKGWYTRREIQISVPTGPHEQRPAEGHTLVTTFDHGVSGEKLFTLAWSYPADDDPSLLWQANVTAATRGDETEVALVLRVGSRTYRVAPPSFRLRRPNIVKTLVQRFECSLGGRRIAADATVITAGDIPGLVDTIRSPERRLPVLLISRDPFSDRTLLDPSVLAGQLIGLAHVRAFADKWASFRLTNLLGKQNSCFNGAVRLYWPAAKATDEVRADRPFMPEEVRGDPELVADRLLRRLSAAAAFRFVEMDVTKSVRGAIERANLEAQARAQAKALADAGDRSELEALVNGLMDEKAKLLATVRQARDDADILRLELAEENERHAELEAELRDLRRNIGVVQLAAPPATANTSNDDVDPATVEEALEEASTRFGARLLIWDTARRSAAACDFARPQEVFRALWAISDVAELYFKSRQDGQPMGRWADAFEDRGFKFAPQETLATMNQYGGEREFSNDGERMQIQKHLTLGGGDKKNCLQIYFDADDAAGRFIVAHCGRHLRTDKYH